MFLKYAKYYVFILTFAQSSNISGLWNPPSSFYIFQGSPFFSTNDGRNVIFFLGFCKALFEGHHVFSCGTCFFCCAWTRVGKLLYWNVWRFFFQYKSKPPRGGLTRLFLGIATVLSYLRSCFWQWRFSSHIFYSQFLVFETQTGCTWYSTIYTYVYVYIYLYIYISIYIWISWSTNMTMWIRHILTW